MFDTSDSSLNIPLTKIETATDKTLSLYLKTKIDLPDDIGELLEPIEGTFTLQIKQKFVLCQGEFDTLIKLNCDRCLEEFELQQDLNINEALEIVEFIDVSPEVELEYQDAFEQITMKDSIDLSDLIRQHIILNLPLKKICSENCYNEDLRTLNEENEKKIDPRWEKLKLISDTLDLNGEINLTPSEN